MKRRLIFPLVAILLFFVACQKEDSAPEYAFLKRGEGEDYYTMMVSFKLKEGFLPQYVPAFHADDVFCVFDTKAGNSREFYVLDGEAVESRLKAVGVMSEGVGATKAFFPGVRVENWRSVDEYTISVPYRQTISDKYPFDTDALVFEANIGASQSEVDFKSAVSLLKFSLTRSDISKVTFGFVSENTSNGAEYEVSMDNGAFSVGKDYYLVVPPGKFSSVEVLSVNGANQLFRFSKDDEPVSFAAEVSCSLDFSSDRLFVNPEISSDKIISSLDEYTDNIPAFQSLDGSMKALLTTVTHTYFSYTEPAHVYNYEYQSVDPDGNPTTLSSALIIPQAAIDEKRPLSKIMLANHFSFMRNDECPTMSNNIEGVFAWKNSAIVLPDYYGFGASSANCQAYLNPEMAGRGSLDALIAAMYLLESLEVEVPEEMVNVGYSQGGFNAIANLAYLSGHPEYPVNFEQTVAGGGPYNVIETFNGYLGGGFDSVFPLVIVTLISFNEIEHLGVDYADIFKGPLLDNYNEWFLSKKYDTTRASSLLETANPADHFTDNVLNGSGPIYDKFTAVADKYSLNKGWTPSADTKIILIHSTADDMVPFSNYESLVEFLDGKCELNKIVYYGMGHVYTYLFFFTNIIANIYPD